MTSVQAVNGAMLERVLDEFNRHALYMIMAFFAQDAALETP